MYFGSVQHRSLMCRSFIETHHQYDVDSIEWPTLGPVEQAFLVDLPVWDEAVNTEYETALLVRAMAEHEPDPEMAEAIALQAFEEERHSILVAALTDNYGIGVTRRPLPRPSDPAWAFRCSGWGEMVDSFVAFGLFALAQSEEIVPKELVELFDLVMQEEARHILFFENWRLYRRHRPGGRSLAGAGADIAALSVDLIARLRLALSVPTAGSGRDDNFLVGGVRALEGLTPRSFVDTCLAEHARRLAPYDPDLRRPSTIPALARRIRKLLPDRHVGAAP